jgi:hypothetical protein
MILRPVQASLVGLQEGISDESLQDVTAATTARLSVRMNMLETTGPLYQSHSRI